MTTDHSGLDKIASLTKRNRDTDRAWIRRHKTHGDDGLAHALLWLHLAVTDLEACRHTAAEPDGIMPLAEAAEAHGVADYMSFQTGDAHGLTTLLAHWPGAPCGHTPEAVLEFLAPITAHITQSEPRRKETSRKVIDEWLASHHDGARD